MNQKFVSSAAVILGLSIFAFSGCARINRNARVPNPPGTTPQGYNIGYNTTTRTAPQILGNTLGPGNMNLGIPDGANLQNSMGGYKQRSDNIRNQLAKMGEITQPNVVMMGNTALVGCRPSNAAADINATKNSVINTVKQADPNVSNVVVTESPDMLNRIGRIANDMAGNRPASEISGEFMQMLRELVPGAR